MFAYRLLLEYDGTAYVGWQRQPAAASVQGELERAISRIMGLDSINLLGAGRTDAGVHALGQVASFRCAVERLPSQLRMGLGALLPADISCREVTRVHEGFHARMHAVGKHYRYRILDGDRRSALRQRYTCPERAELDVDAMTHAARHLLGTHDFTSFRAAGSSVPGSVRCLTRLDLGRRGDEVHLDVEGGGFLRHMVRIIAGTLLEVGRGRRQPGELVEILAACDRAAAGRTAPALGLCLMRVDYRSDDALAGA